MSRELNFDHLARPYRWLEYATFGRALERCRFHFLPALIKARRALVLGDGDGRFLERLLRLNTLLEADVIDISPVMLHLQEKRLKPEGRRRVTLHQGDARKFIPFKTHYDLVVTHFFLDCLSQPELAALIQQIAFRLEPQAIWIVSEFVQPQGRFASRAGNLIISALYRAFGLLTGLPVRSLPDHSSPLKNTGFQLVSEQRWLRGLLVSQFWQRSHPHSMQPVDVSLPSN